MRQAITTAELEAPAPREHRERVRITTAEINLPVGRGRKPGVKGFVDVIKTSELDENRKLKAAPAAAVEETGAKKGGRAKEKSS